MLVVLIIVLGTFYYNYKNHKIYEVKENALSYSKNRGSPNYEIALQSSNVSYNVYEITYESRPLINFSTTIYALLFMPKNKENVPALLFLPAGGGAKEGRAPLAIDLAKQGYAVMTIDQRGVGQTGGYYLNFEDDYNVFIEGYEPVQHLSVYDALSAFDVLREIENIDKDNIAISGESMGGRYAIIAAALDDRIKGALIISSAGFHIKQIPSLSANPYFASIDPDNYIGKIAPRQLIMMHAENDSIISLADAQLTFSKANEPKKFYLIGGCQHGYCDKMHDALMESLKKIFIS